MIDSVIQFGISRESVWANTVTGSPPPKQRLGECGLKPEGGGPKHVVE